MKIIMMVLLPLYLFSSSWFYSVDTSFKTKKEAIIFMNSIEDIEMFIAYEEENVYRIYTGLHYDEDSKPIKEKFDKKKIEVTLKPFDTLENKEFLFQQILFIYGEKKTNELIEANKKELITTIDLMTYLTQKD